MKGRHSPIRYHLAGLGVCMAVWFAASVGLSEHFDGFESDRPTWQLLDADNRVSLLAHDRVGNERRSGAASEYFRISATDGSYAYLAQTTPPAAIIEEIAPSLWVKASRPGMQLLARATLPRTISRQTGKPMTALLHGPLYGEAGSWRKLEFENLYEVFQRQVRIMRSQTSQQIDAREAYIDMVVVNAYGGAGVTDIWVDDLEIKAAVAPAAPTINLPARSTNATTGSATTPRATPTDIQLRGGAIQIEGRPTFISAIEYNGESLSHLRELGFNAVVLSQPADDDLRRRAERQQMWLISPPPVDLIGSQLDSRYDRVLAWTLGADLTSNDLSVARLRAQNLRRNDLKRRPMICGVADDLWNFSRIGDISLLSRGGPYSAFDSADLTDWLRQQQRLARVGSPLWMTVPTESPASLVKQIQAIYPRETGGPIPQWSQLRAHTFRAIAGGARGLVFQSRSSLQSAEPQSRRRSMLLKRLNLELRNIEPWIAIGESLGDSRTTDPEIRVTSLRLESSRLLIALRDTPAAQYASVPALERTLRFVDETAPTASRAWLVSPTHLEPLRTGRKPGGVEVTIDTPTDAALILLTESPGALRDLSKRMGESSRLAAQLEYTIVQTELTEAATVIDKLEQQGQALPRSDDELGRTRANVQQAERLMISGDYRASLYYSANAMRTLHSVRRQHWERASLVFPSPSSSPLCCSFQTLPMHFELGEHLQQAKWGVNHLAGGSLENLDHLLQAGWRNHRAPDSPLNTIVQIDPAAAHSGAAGLRIKASQKDDATGLLTTIESAPVWITSAPTPVRAGTLVRIHGWARLESPVKGSSDGLMISDSLGGDALGHRLTEAGQWKEFTLYRAVDKDGELFVRFALSGIGEAWLDDVSITPAPLPAVFPKREQAARQPAATR